MRKEIFKEKIAKLNEIGIEKICKDFYMEPDSHLFVKSPKTQDRTKSLKLYPLTNSFADFANGRQGGDCIYFISYLKGINNWEAMKLLSDYYGLSGTNEWSRAERRSMILRQQEQEKRKTERQQAFHKALFALIDDLKTQEDKYRLVLEKSKIEPFSDLWAYILNELQIVSYKLDILTGADQRIYRRMKPDVTRGIASDRPQWLLDVLSILQEAGVFTATTAELTEIRAQRDFELRRKPGADRRCAIEWQ